MQKTESTNESVAVRPLHTADARVAMPNVLGDALSWVGRFSSADVEVFNTSLLRTISGSKLFNEAFQIDSLDDLDGYQKYILNTALRNHIIASAQDKTWILSRVAYAITDSDRNVLCSWEVSACYTYPTRSLESLGSAKNKANRAAIYRILKDVTACVKNRSRESVSEYEGVRYFDDIDTAISELPPDIVGKGVIFVGLVPVATLTFSKNQIDWQDMVDHSDFDWTKLP
jgi:hypothetical protein